jgi:hypothetical protein
MDVLEEMPQSRTRHEVKDMVNLVEQAIVYTRPLFPLQQDVLPASDSRPEMLQMKSKQRLDSRAALLPHGKWERYMEKPLALLATLMMES